MLHNNAAGIIHGRNVLQTSGKAWDAELATTLKEVFLGCKTVLPAMVAQGSGSIINTSSTAGISADQTSAAKGGVIQLIWSIAVDFEHRGVRDGDYLSDETVVFKKVIRDVCRSNPALPNQSRSESQR